MRMSLDRHGRSRAGRPAARSGDHPRSPCSQMTNRARDADPLKTPRDTIKLESRDHACNRRRVAADIVATRTLHPYPLPLLGHGTREELSSSIGAACAREADWR